MEKVLVIRLSSIGDIVLSSLSIRCLKNKYPDVQIDFLTKSHYKSVVKGIPGITQILELKDSLWKTAQEIVAQEYDLIIDLQSNLRTKVLKQLLPESLTYISYNKKSFKRWISVLFKKNFYGNEKVPEQYLQTLREFGVVNDGKGLDYKIQESDWIYKKDLPLSHSSGYAVFSIGATHFTKKLPIEKWIDICQNLNVPIILIGGNEDVQMGSEIAHSDELKIVNKCGKYTIGQSASVMQQSIFVLTHDTGMMHIAAALKKKVISIWGGTVPYLGFQPYVLDSELSVIVENNAISCRPCSKYGKSHCPKGHFQCMKNIPIDQVVNACNLKEVDEY